MSTSTRIFRFICIIALLAASLSACQPTPVEPIVVGKEQEEMLEQAQPDPSPQVSASPTASISLSQKYGIPERYTYEFSTSKDNLSISIDAKVEAPDAAAIPIYRVEMAQFTQEQASGFFDALCGDTEMWNYQYERTKDQLLDQIVEVKRHIAELEATDPSSDELKRAYDSLELLEEMAATAPDTLEETRSHGEIIVKEEDEYAALEIYEKNPEGLDGRGKSLQIVNGLRPYVWYSDYGIEAGRTSSFDGCDTLQIFDDTSVEDRLIESAGLTPDEARQQVEDLLQQVCPEMTVDAVFLETTEAGSSYKVTCVRTIGGIPCSYTVSGSTTASAVALPWSYEDFFVRLNSEGIFEVMWTQPLAVTDTIMEETSLLTFDAIEDNFEKNLPILYEARADLYQEIDVSLNRAVLSLHRILEQNSEDTCLLVPAWTLYGTEVLTGGDTTMIRAGEACLIVNAVDGSLIDQTLGY